MLYLILFYFHFPFVVSFSSSSHFFFFIYITTISAPFHIYMSAPVFYRLDIVKYTHSYIYFILTCWVLYIIVSIFAFELSLYKRNDIVLVLSTKHSKKIKKTIGWCYYYMSKTEHEFNKTKQKNSRKNIHEASKLLYRSLY